MVSKVVAAWEGLAPGYKTYAVALVAAAYNFAVAVGWLNASDQLAINGVLGALGVAGIRAAK